MLTHISGSAVVVVTILTNSTMLTYRGIHMNRSSQVPVFTGLGVTQCLQDANCVHSLSVFVPSNLRLTYQLWWFSLTIFFPGCFSFLPSVFSMLKCVSCTRCRVADRFWVCRVRYWTEILHFWMSRVQRPPICCLSRKQALKSKTWGKHVPLWFPRTPTMLLLGTRLRLDLGEILQVAVVFDCL